MTYPENTELKSNACRHSWRWLAALGLLAGLAGTAQAQARFSYTSDGAAVIDATTGLTWQRCSVGQTWSADTCTGTATSLTHEAALTFAKDQTGWRLPNVKELFSLVDRTVINPSIDSVAFPETPTRSNGYWSASPSATDAAYAWSVAFSGGFITANQRIGTYLVRLVR